MQLPELSIRRPVMTTLMTASIIAFGVFAFRLLPVSALPKVDFPTIAVTATLPGASADTMAASAAAMKKIADAADPLYKTLDEGQRRRLSFLTRMDDHSGGWRHRMMDRGSDRDDGPGRPGFDRDRYDRDGGPDRGRGERL